MAHLKEEPKWEEGVYCIELTDPVVGGEDGIDNIQAKQLANRTSWLREKLVENEETVKSYSPEMQQGIFSGLQFSMDMAALAMKEHEQTRLTRFQEISAIIKNRGVKTGVTLSKSSTATRNISCSDGVVFMAGREFTVANQTNTASIASNTTASTGTVIIYMFQTAAGAIDVAATTLNGQPPAGSIELARASVPAGNTEENDPYLARVTITDSARREPGWPRIQLAPAEIQIALNRSLPDSAYLVEMEVQSCLGGNAQLGDIVAKDKLKNGFKLMSTGNADEINVRMLIQHPAI